MQIHERYQVIEEIGAGGMGTVFRGVDLHTQQAVAIKLLKPEAASHAEAVERFGREAEALRQLDHPNIVKVLETFRDDDQHYIVMEYVSGGSLHDLLRRQPQLPVERVLQIGIELADALTRAHYLRIIHRDLKPANVMLDEHGTSKLSDFGVAYIGAKERVTKADALVGTPDYLSPEALRSAVDTRSDIWAFGVMLFEMLAGSRPFVGETVAHVITSILMQPTPDLEAQRPDAPVALVDLVYRMLQKDRSARIPSVRLVGAELEALIHGDSPRLLQTPTPSEARRFTPSASVGEARRQHNLPAQTTPFVGRDEELREINRLLESPDVRLLTLLGPGGMGKTRLSIEAARAQLDQFANGVYFVALAPLGSPEFILPEIAEALRFSFFGSDTPRQQLLNYLEEKQLLLVMDNFEHLIEGAEVVAAILSAAPGVKVLATSRERLHLQGEWVLEVEGMRFPEIIVPDDLENYTAVRMFMQSAHRANPSFELDADSAPSVARITRMVQGMPLGIELAAAWLEALTIAEIVAEMERSPDFLETDMRDVPERHRSIRAVFDYSWNLLTDAERELFKRLSVFRGGFEREAAQQVAEASLRLLTALVNKSLVRRSPTGHFQIHELLRQYALERLKESVADYGRTLDAHAGYYAGVVEKAGAIILTEQQKMALAIMNTDMENIRAAWWWAVERKQPEWVEPLLDGLTYYFNFTGRFGEGLDVFRILEQKLGDSPSAEDERLYWLARSRIGWMLTRTGLYEEGGHNAGRSLEAFRRTGDRHSMIFDLNTLCYADMMRGDLDDSKRFGEEAVLLAEAEGDAWGVAFGKANLGYLAFLRGDYPEARTIYEELFASVAAASPVGKAHGYNNLGEILREMGDYDQAKTLFEQAYVIFRDFNNRWGMAFSANNLGGIFFRRGDYAEAEAKFRESYALSREIGDKTGVGHALSALGNTAHYQHDYPEAEKQYRAALAVRREINNQRGIADSLNDLGDVALVLGRPDEAKQMFEESLAIRRQIGDLAGVASALLSTVSIDLLEAEHNAIPHLEEALAISTSLGHLSIISGASSALGMLHVHQENVGEGLAYLKRGLEIGRDLGAILLIQIGLVGFAALLCRTNQPERSLELIGLARRYPQSLPVTQTVIRQLMRELEPSLPPDALAAALERGKALDIEAVMVELLAENASDA